MKRILHLLLIVLIPFSSFSQGNVIGKNLKISQQSKLIGSTTIGSSNFDASAILTLTSTSQGFLPPRMTTPERDDIISATTGLLIFNTDLNAYQFFDGANFVSIGGGGAGSFFTSIAYVDAGTGDDGTAILGSSALPFQSILQGQTLAGPTGLVYVLPGTYIENGLLSTPIYLTKGAHIDAPITNQVFPNGFQVYGEGKITSRLALQNRLSTSPLANNILVIDELISSGNAAFRPRNNWGATSFFIKGRKWSNTATVGMDATNITKFFLHFDEIETSKPSFKTDGAGAYYFSWNKLRSSGIGPVLFISGNASFRADFDECIITSSDFAKMTVGGTMYIKGKNIEAVNGRIFADMRGGTIFCDVDKIISGSEILQMNLHANISEYHITSKSARSFNTAVAKITNTSATSAKIFLNGNFQADNSEIISVFQGSKPNPSQIYLTGRFESKFNNALGHGILYSNEIGEINEIIFEDVTMILAGQALGAEALNATIAKDYFINGRLVSNASESLNMTKKGPGTFTQSVDTK